MSVDSILTSAPLQSVTERMNSTGSVFDEFTVWVAPNCFAGASTFVDVDGDDRVRAAEVRPGGCRVAHAAEPERCDGITASNPTGLDRCTEAGHDASAEEVGDDCGHAQFDLRALAPVHERLLGERADGERWRELDAILGRIFCAPLHLGKRYHGRRGAGRPGGCRRRPAS